MPYIETHQSEPDCFLCEALEGSDDASTLLVHRGEEAFVILNRYPYINGHILIAPNGHEPTIEDLPRETLAELMELTSKASRVLRAVYSADAFNIGMNIGAAAGAGLADHVHIHVLPRWAGDTNFMTTTAATRVLPETLEETWKRISKGWQTTR